MNPELEQLARYISQELDRGIPESTLKTALLQRGWTPEWVEAGLRLARQQPAPVQAQPSPPRFTPVTPALPQPEHRPQQPAAMPHTSQDIIQERKPNRAKSFLILGAVLAALLIIGVGAYLLITGMNRAEADRRTRDNLRKEHLSALLSDLSDYYVAHASYPTREQLSDVTFLQTNGFKSETTRDPQWSPSEQACTKNGKPVLATTLTPHCYAYQTRSSGGACDNAATPCTRMTLTMDLEKDKPTSVTFDQNTEAE